MAAVRLDCDAELRLEDFGAQITQKIGEPLDPAKVAESLRNLYATGRFTELRAEAEPRDTGVELTFVARAQFFVGVVRVEGTPDPVDPRALATATRLRLGQPLTEDALAAASQRLATVLADNGYYQARIELGVLRHPDNQVADLAFSVVPGAPARLSGVEFQGHPSVPAERLAAVAGWRRGKHLTSPKLERGLFKIQQFYAQRGRLQATASLQKRTYRSQLNTEQLLVQVEAGPLMQVRVRGARVPRSKMKEFLPVFRDGVADETSLTRGVRNLEDYFEQRGYFSVSVKVDQAFRADSQRLDITYTVILGQPGEFVGYAFRGNRSVRLEDLIASLSLRPQSGFRSYGLFSRALLARDVNTLTGLYQSRGFLEARVSAHLDDRYQNRPGHLFVTFEVAEGPRTTVGNLALQGVDTETQRKIWPHLLAKSGQPYSPVRAQIDRDVILDYLADRGYTQASVTWYASPAAAEHEVDLEYRIELGAQERIQRVVLLGDHYTRPGIIRRELAFRQGEPLSQGNFLESQRRLYDLGIFNQVQVGTQEPEGLETARTVLVSVEEARRWTVGYGGGLEVQRLGSDQPEGQLKASPRLSFELTRLNVGGRAQTFTLRGRLSNLEKSGAISYLIPRFPTRRDLSLRLNALVDRSRDVLTFTAEREEASVSIEKQFSPAALVLGRYSFRRVLVDSATLRISPQAIPLLSRPARIAMLGVSYANDHRDDPADATKGSYSQAEAGISWSTLGSEANFLRLSGQNATYYRLGSHLIFARHTRFAVGSPFGGLREVVIKSGEQAGQVIRTHDIPLPERFFMGGSESHRGFSINQAGPRDPLTGFPIGGNALFFNSLELRMPFAENRFGIALFHDAGNVFSSIRRMRLLKFTQNSPTDFDFTAHALGLGFRYRTPLGPVRIDVGYNPNPTRFQVQSTQGMEVRRLSHFQFFLSIGQSF